MRLSRFPLLARKEIPKETTVASHYLMIRAGMIYQTARGIYSWLPLGNRVLKKVEKIIREEQEKIGAHEVLLPTIHPADLWKKSGRYDAYGQEMLRFRDRHNREMLYAPTAEELMASIAKYHIQSYHDLPKMFYQIQWKFRDEIRPRFGVMRSREFYMKDCYSFDLSTEDATRSYHKMLLTYIRTFTRMGIKVLPVRARSGAIGGSLSQEFHILAPAGESFIFYDENLESLIEPKAHKDLVIDHLMSTYAVESSLHNPSQCPVPDSKLKKARSIEVGHIFFLGTKYSEVLGITVTGRDGKKELIQMSSYGIGLSRLVGAIIEANHDKDGIIFPATIAPFKIGLILVNPDDILSHQIADEIESRFESNSVEVLYDDRKEYPGIKFSTMDLIGIPWQIRVKSRTAGQKIIEVKCRQDGQVEEISIESAMNYLNHLCSD